MRKCLAALILRFLPTALTARDEGGEYDHAENAPSPAGIAFEKFASFGTYSSYRENDGERERPFAALDLAGEVQGRDDGSFRRAEFPSVRS